MADMFGLSFTPGLQRRFTNAINGQSPLTPGQSQALQVLALRLPGFLGSSSPAPESLLRRPIGGTRPDLAVRSLVAPPQYAPSAQPNQPATPDVAAQPSPSAISRLQGPIDAPRAQSSFLNPFASITDAGSGGQTPTRPDSPFLSFDQRPTTGEPTTGTTPTTPDLNALMNSLFGGGNSGGNFGNDSGQDTQYI